MSPQFPPNIFNSSPLANGGWLTAMRSVKLASEAKSKDGDAPAENPWLRSAKLVGAGSAGMLLGMGMGLGAARLGEHLYQARFGTKVPYSAIAPAMGVLGTAVALSGMKLRDKTTEEVRNAFESRRRGG